MEPQKDLHGILFRNKDRTTDKQPNATGRLSVGGVEYRLAAWTKTASTGEKFQSLQLSLPKPPEEPVKIEPEAVPEDDIPF